MTFWCLSLAELLSNESTMYIFTVSCAEDYARLQGETSEEHHSHEVTEPSGEAGLSLDALMLAMLATGPLNPSRFRFGKVTWLDLPKSLQLWKNMEAKAPRVLRERGEPPW